MMSMQVGGETVSGTLSRIFPANHSSGKVLLRELQTVGGGDWIKDM